MDNACPRWRSSGCIINMSFSIAMCQNFLLFWVRNFPYYMEIILSPPKMLILRYFLHFPQKKEPFKALFQRCRQDSNLQALSDW